MKPKLVVLTGAGISAESGIQTFRGLNGLWEGHKIEDVASPGGWDRDPEMVLEFYNLRRKNVREVEPNKAHLLLKELEQKFRVQIITQNIDDLHERAGSSEILHLHGEILKASSSKGQQREVIELNDKDIQLGDLCTYGTQLRPFIVWFGEDVPMIEKAVELVIDADIVVIIGTSLAVYPAAGLIQYSKEDALKYIIDPNIPDGVESLGFKPIKKGGGEGMEILFSELMS